MTLGQVLSATNATSFLKYVAKRKKIGRIKSRSH